MKLVEPFVFDYPNQYAHIYTEATRAAFKRPGKGRRAVRYDIVKRDGELTIVIHNITLAELKAYQTMAETQGSRIW